MARTFNESILSVTDVFENAGIKNLTYKFFEEVSDSNDLPLYSSDGIFLMKKVVFLASLRNLLFHTNFFNIEDAESYWTKMSEFIETSNSEYVLYE